jgi:hypothetical protein
VQVIWKIHFGKKAQIKKHPEQPFSNIAGARSQKIHGH